HGMETILMTLLVTLSAYWFIGEWEAERAGSEKVGLGSAFALAGCALTRPEGLLFGLLALVLLVGSKRGRLNRREVRWLLALLVPVGAFLLWRHAYYGLWLPNTYWAKNPPLDTAVVRGSLYLLNTFFTFIYRAYYLPFALGWWLLALAGAASDRFRRPPALLGSLFILVQIVHVLRSGGDWMTGWRYMGPVLPLLMLLSVAGIAEIAEGLKRLGQASGPTLARAAISTLCAFFVTACLISYTQDYWKGAHNGLVSWASRGFTLNEREMLRGWGIERAIHLSEWLNAHLPPGSVVVYTEMGVTP